MRCKETPVEQEARRIVRRYRIHIAAVLTALVGGYILLLLFVPMPTVLQVLPALLMPIAYGVALNLFVRKDVQDLLLTRLDAPLYQAVLERLNWHNLVPVLTAEYALGHFARVAAICRRELASERVLGKRCACLLYLAHCAFDCGDDAGLREICAQYDAELGTAPPQGRAKISARLPRMDFYRAYANRDDAFCTNYAARSPKTCWEDISLCFVRARLALRQGDAISANVCFSTIAERAPKLHFSALAAYGLTAIASGLPYAVPPVPSVDENLPRFPGRRVRGATIFLQMLGWLGIVCGALLLAGVRWGKL